MTWEDIGSLLNEILSYTLFQLKNTPVTVLSVLIFLIFISAFIFLGIVVRKTLHRRVLKRFKIDPGTSYTLSRISQYLIIIIGALIAFQFIGIDLSGLAVIFGLLSVGIGFGLQNVTANFISGLIILFERPISIGDRVMVNDIEGDVIEINIRATKIRTLNNVFIIVQLRVWIGDVKNYPEIRNELNQAIVRKFRQNDIEIPFPQRDLHLRTTTVIPTKNE